MTSDDDYGFWDDERDRSHLPGIPLLDRSGQRRENGWGSRPRLSASRLASPRQSVQRRHKSGVPNPMLRRLGALCAVGLVALPVAYVIRGSDTAEQIGTAGAADAASGIEVVDGAATDSAEIVPVVTVPGPVTIAVPVPPATVAPVATAAATAAIEVAAGDTAAADTAVPETVAPETAADDTAAAQAAVPSSSERTHSASAAAGSSAGGAVAVAQVVDTKRTCAASYTLLAGDYWIGIADRASLELSELLRVNGANVNTPLYPGREICLPAGAVVSAPTPPTSTTAKPTPTTAKPSATATPTTTKPKVSSTTAPAATPAPTTQAPATTAAPTTTEPRPQNNYTKAQVEAIIRAVWPDELEEEALRIAYRESNLIPTVRNYCCYGLFQIYFNVNKQSLVSWGVTSPAALYDPQVNAFVAYAMYLRAGGWGPWAL